MKPMARILTVVLLIALLIACSPAASQTGPAGPGPAAAFTPSLPASRTAVTPPGCTPTLGDELSPSYKPDAPVRSVVGQGHILTGVVRSSVNCDPIQDAKVELWPEEPGVGHPDEYRATVYTDNSGAYRFQCNPTDHIHMRISAPGYRTIASNAYHPAGQPEGVFDIVLEPVKP